MELHAIGWAQGTAPATEIIVGAGEMKVARDPSVPLAALSLGSSIAVLIYDSHVRVGGIVRILLPQSFVSGKTIRENPFLFASSGIPDLLSQCAKWGGRKDRLDCYLVGGADFMNGSGGFQLGRDNHESAVEVFRRLRLNIRNEWTGGIENRSVRLHLGDGRVVVTTPRSKVLAA